MRTKAQIIDERIIEKNKKRIHDRLVTEHRERSERIRFEREVEQLERKLTYLDRLRKGAKMTYG